MQRRNAAIRSKNDIAIIKRPRHSVPLRNADAHIGLSPFSRLAKHLRLLAGNHDGAIIIALPVLPTGLLATAHSKAKGHAKGIAGYNQLWQHD